MVYRKTVAVIGAGIAGVTAAYYLAKEGYIVTVYDQESYPGMQCSYANGGQLSVSNSETWHSWSNIVKGFKWLLKDDAPLLIRPSLDLDKAIWLTRFLVNTINGVREQNTAKTILLGLEARQLYNQIAMEEGISFDYSQRGILHFYKNVEYFTAAKNLQRLYEDNGCEWTPLTPSQVYEHEPLLYNSGEIVGGVWTADDAMGDIHKFCVELMRVLREKYGVMFKSNKVVDASVFESIPKIYDHVVISAGAESTKFAKFLGDKCTIYPVKGYSVTINVSDADIINIPKTSLLDDQAKIVTSTLGNRFRVAGTAELDGYNYDIRKSRINPLLGWVKENFPDLRADNYSSWACLRPMTADMMPMVCRSRHPSVYYHTGHGHLGWTLAPATAKSLVDLVNGNNR